MIKDEEYTPPPIWAKADGGLYCYIETSSRPRKRTFWEWLTRKPKIK